MKKDVTVRSSAAEYLTFITASGESQVEAIYFDENVWLTQKMMATLYDVGKIQSIIILKKYSRMRIVNRRKMQLFENFE